MFSRGSKIARLIAKCVDQATVYQPGHQLNFNVELAKDVNRSLTVSATSIGYHHQTKRISDKCIYHQQTLTVSPHSNFHRHRIGYNLLYSDRLFNLGCSISSQASRTYRTGSHHRMHRSSISNANEKLKDSTVGEDVSVKRVDEKSERESVEDTPQTGSLFQRFKQAYREHGKILIGVHVLTSTVWFGSFFYAASVGIDVVPWLEHIGLSETIIKPFKSSNVGNIAMAYLMYKLATPARYTVTLGGTNLMIKYLRRTGRMEPVPQGHSLRELYKEGKVQISEHRHKIPKLKPKTKHSKVGHSSTPQGHHTKR